ncbi:MAG TPA: EAL domain-containing protein [Pseudomonadales bacterium]|nr:EAL domain-containing protein [Pseudomonadales bacterium]
MSSQSVISDLVTYLNKRDFLNSSLQDDSRHPIFINGDRVNASYANIEMDTLFQPVFNITKNTVAGHEAFLSVQTPSGVKSIGKMLSPQALFFLPSETSGISYLDRLARTLHALNFLVQENTGLLHLNVHPNHLLAVDKNHGQFFEGVLRQCGIAPEQIVLEVIEYAVTERRKLSAAIQAWKEKGYRIAIDNFGRAHSNVERLTKLNPHVVKIDRSYFVSLLSYPGLIATLKNTIQRGRDVNIEWVAAGIETQEQLDLAVQLGVDYVQGYYLGTPSPVCHPHGIALQKKCAQV